MRVTRKQLRKIISSTLIAEISAGPSISAGGGGSGGMPSAQTKERCCDSFTQVGRDKMPDDWAGPPPYYVDACGNPRGIPVYDDDLTGNNDGAFLYSCSWTEGSGDLTTIIKKVADETGFSDVVHLVASVAPGTGDAMDAAEVHRILTTEPENYGGLGMAMFGFIPLLGDLSKGFKAAKKAGNAAETKKVSDEIMKHSEDIAAAAKKRRTIAKSSAKIRSAKAIAAKLPWADKKLWILRGTDRGFTGAHQVVALKNKQGQTFLFYKSSGSNPDEFGNISRDWIRFHGFTPKSDGAGGGYFWFIKDSPGKKANPPGLKSFADQLNELDKAVEGPGIAFITKHLPDFKIESITDNMTREGIEDISRFHKWADSLGATTEYGKQKGLPGINISTERIMKAFKL